jgi:hypothetical protein
MKSSVKINHELVEAHKRVLFIAEHLFEMIPQSVWRDSGGDDMQGHYEGDYHAEQVREELVKFRRSLTAMYGVVFKIK